MKINSNPDNRGSRVSSKVAFLWDESFLWGLMSYKAFLANGLSFDLIGCEDVRKGKLKEYAMLFVPGGWASNKLKSLGKDGVSAIEQFVREGGSYLGFCGGAGLATMDGMGLLNVRRKPTKERVPSLSGRIRFNLKAHPIWTGLVDSGESGPGRAPSDIFQVWWPSQFVVTSDTVKVLATYAEAMDDSFSSDLNVGDTRANEGWSELEKAYAINLDPARLRNEPAVVEGMSGKGRVILSLVHFDTPDDHNGSVVLKNLWQHLAEEKAAQYAHTSIEGKTSGNSDDVIVRIASGLEAKVQELISFGIRNFLWFWRNRMLLQWRRGVRGLEYCTLYTMVKEIAGILKLTLPSSADDAAFPGELRKGIDTIQALLVPFVDDAKRLLFMERLAMQNGHITYERCDDREVTKIREELFSTSKSYGGSFKNLIDEIDRVLFGLLRLQHAKK